MVSISEISDEIIRKADSSHERSVEQVDVQPKGSKLVSSTFDRFIFEKDNRIIKVARTIGGIDANTQAKRVMEHADKSTGAFAMPLEFSEENGVMIQEKAKSLIQYHGENGAYHGDVGKSPIDALEDGIYCHDIKIDNIGVHGNKGLVLIDLGMCNVTDPIPEHDLEEWKNRVNSLWLKPPRKIDEGVSYKV